MNRIVESHTRADPSFAEWGLGPEAALAPCITREFLHYHRICPIRILEDGTLLAATEPSTVPAAGAELEIAYSRRVRPVIWQAERVQLAIERLTPRGETMIIHDVRLPGVEQEVHTNAAGLVATTERNEPGHSSLLYLL